jgi:hypothetical protein
MKQLYLLVFVTILSCSHALAVQPQTVFVRIFETQNVCTKSGVENQILVTYPDGKTLKVALEKLKDNDMFSSNALKITETLNKVNQEGYVITSSSSSMWECYVITTFTLSK